MKIIKLKSVDSTNNYLKRLDFDGDVAVIAETQTAGRGTKGRSFSSLNGGLFISVARTRLGEASQTFKIMINSCVAVCRTLEFYGLRPRIKWANDVLIGDKKICGTLIENTLFSNGRVRSIVGMGINVNNELPEELKGIATSLSLEGVRTEAKEVGDRLLENLQKDYSVEDYKRYIDWFGKEITVVANGETFRAVAVGVEGNGCLKCLSGGREITLSSAEVSLKL